MISGIFTGSTEVLAGGSGSSPGRGGRSGAGASGFFAGPLTGTGLYGGSSDSGGLVTGGRSALTSSVDPLLPVRMIGAAAGSSFVGFSTTRSSATSAVSRPMPVARAWASSSIVRAAVSSFRARHDLASAVRALTFFWAATLSWARSIAGVSSSLPNQAFSLSASVSFLRAST